MGAALPLVGNIAGSMLGGPLGGMIGGMIGGLLMPAVHGPELKNLSVQSSAFGTPIPIIFNDYRIAGNIIWAIPLQNHPSSSKKSGQKVVTNKYYGSCAIMLCQGPISGVRRIWADGKLIYDGSAPQRLTGGPLILSSTSAQTTAGTIATPVFENGCGVINDTMKLYLGTEEQLPDPFIEGHLGVGQTPAFRGTAYMVVQDLALEAYGNRIPNFEFEVMNYTAAVADVADKVATTTDYDGTLSTAFFGNQTDTFSSLLGTIPDYNQKGFQGFRAIYWDRITVMRFWYPDLSDTSFKAEGTRLSEAFTDPATMLEAMFQKWAPYLTKFDITFLPKNLWTYNFQDNTFGHPFRVGDTADSVGIANVGLGLTAYFFSILGIYCGIPDAHYLKNNVFVYQQSCAKGYTLSPDGSYCAKLNFLPYSVGDIFREVSAQVGIPPELLDVSQVTDTVQGYILPQRASARQLLSDLMTIFAFDLVESDLKLKLQKRHLAPYAGLIPYDDLSVQKSGAGYKAPVQATRSQDFELPDTVEVGYSDPSLAYRANLQRARRRLGAANGIQTMSVPAVLNVTQAITLAETILAQTWYSRTTYELQLGTKWAHLNPGDVVDVPVDASVQRMLIRKIEYDTTGLVKVTAVQFDYGIHGNLAAVPQSAPVTVARPIVTLVNPTLLLLDVPLLNDADEGPGFYAAAGTASSLTTAALALADSSGAYSAIGTLSTAATMGTTASMLAPAPQAQVVDALNSVDVRIENGEVFSVTASEMLAGANLALIGDEIIQFQTATFLTEKVWRLSQLTRGRKGTEDKMSGHTPGERFVLLDSHILRVATTLATTGIPASFKALNPELPADSADAVAFTNNNKCLQPYAPVSLTFAPSAGLAGVDIRWVRRTRLGGEWRSFVDAALGESTESYTVCVLNADNSVAARYTTTAPNFTYTTVQAKADLNPLLSTFNITVAQNSSTVGPGTAATLTVTLP